MQIKSVETIVLSLISWKQINGLGKQQLMNAMLPTVMDSTVHATVVAPATRIMSINSHTQIMVLVATSRSIPLKLSMFSLTSTSLTINSVHLWVLWLKDLTRFNWLEIVVQIIRWQMTLRTVWPSQLAAGQLMIVGYGRTDARLHPAMEVTSTFITL